MFNLIVGFTDGVATRDRVLEYTDEGVKAFLCPGDSLDLVRLATLPTVVMPETGFSHEKKVARVGRLSNLRRQGRELRFDLVDTPSIPSIGTDQIEARADELGIRQFEFSRTHWAVKEGDLYGALSSEVEL